MKVLAIDTSNLVLGVAVADENRLLGEVITNQKKNHSVRLMPTIQSLLDDLDLSPRELDGIAVAKGPGSYTGVRIGVATAKSLSWSLQRPLVGISSLEVLAAHFRYENRLISPLFDARRGQVFTGLYRGSENGRLQRVEEDRIILLDDWLQSLSDRGGAVVFLGDDVSQHRERIESTLPGKALFAEPELNVPRPGYLARMAIERISAEETENVHAFAPVYLQLAEAEKKWLAKQK